jgi:hypothetical protein
VSFLPALIHGVYDSPLPTAIRESEIAFPVIQTFHILGILLMVGSIAVVDLRLLGVLLRQRPVIDVARPLLPFTWIGFGVMALSGGALFAAQAEKIYGNIFLQVKFALLIIAGINVVVFHSTTYRSIEDWGAAISPPSSARIAGALSLLLWSAVIVTGRFIAYY